MPERITRNLPAGWGTTDLLLVGVALSVTTALVSLAATGAVLVRLPSDYFACDPRTGACRTRPRYIHWPLLLLKNLLGLGLVALGVVLSFPGVPGQGILTILIGAMLLDFPGKRRLERWLVRRRGVLSTINKVRARYGREPLILDAPPTAA